MQITINNKIYNYEMKGTIGPAFVVEQMSGEPFNPWGRKEKNEKGELVEVEKPKPLHTILLFLVILQFSNPDQKDELTLDWLLEHLTTSVMNDLTTYTVKRWAELEGWKGDDEDGTDKKTNPEDSKND